VKELRASGIPVKTALDAGVHTASDPAVVAWSKRQKRVLLTFNHHDFWSDRDYPLQQSPGMIIVQIPNDRVPQAIVSIDHFCSVVAKRVSLDHWTEMKVRVLESDYVIKRREQGLTVAERIKVVGDRLFCRRIKTGSN
jgi:hypothetical protein